MTASSQNSPQAAAPGLNDGNLGVDVKLTDSGDIDNAYEAAGVVWSAPQTIGQVNFLNGVYDAFADGVFVQGFALQFSTDGATWSNSGWTATPTYAYDSPSAANKTYVFSGAPVAGIRGVRVIGQVHLPIYGSWFVNAREVQAFGGSGGGATATPAPTSTSTATPAPPTNTPVGPTNTPAPATVTATPGSGNIAPGGTAYRWYGMTANNQNSPQAVAVGLNDGNLGIDVKLTNSGDIDNAYEAAGVVWPTAQTIGQVNFLNGNYDAFGDGVFVQGFALQLSTDGATWSNSGWTVAPAYAYDSPSAANKTYVFSGPPVAGVRGVRVIGQVHLPAFSSWFVNAREVQAFSGSGPVVTATPQPPATATATPTATPLPGVVNVKVNFQPSAAQIPAGYLSDSGAIFASRGNGYSYGWNASNNRAVDRNSARSPDQRFDTLIPMQTGGQFSWEIAVPNGTYRVVVVAGDPNVTNASYRVNAESTLIVNGTASASTRWHTGTADIVVSDGRLTLSSATGASNTRLAFVEIQNATGAQALEVAPAAVLTEQMARDIRSQRAARVASFTASTELNGIRLLWTEGKMRFAGFRIYRSATGNRDDAVELTTRLMPSQGSVDAPYGFLDDTAQLGVSYSYWLAFIDKDGSTVEIGAIEWSRDSGAQSYYLPVVQAP